MPSGVRLNIKMSTYLCRITILKIRRSYDRLIFNMGIPISGKDGLYIETGPDLYDGIFYIPKDGLYWILAHMIPSWAIYTLVELISQQFFNELWWFQVPLRGCDLLVCSHQGHLISGCQGDNWLPGWHQGPLFTSMVDLNDEIIFHAV